MTRATGRPSSQRLFVLAFTALVVAILLFAKYYRLSDTATLLTVSQAVSSPIGADSSYYMNLGEDAFRAPGHRIFPKLFFEQHQKFIYPPSSLFVIEALNLTPSPVRARGALLLAGWLATLLIAISFFRQCRGSITTLEALSVTLLAILFLPIAEALYRGQMQLLMTFLWGLAALLWQRERRGWAGFFLALTCTFKPQLALFLLWGLLRKEWRFAGVFTATVAVISAFSIAHFGLQNNLDYISVLIYLSRHGEALWANQSMNGLLNRLLHNGDAGAWNPSVYPPFRPAVFILSSAFAFVAVLTGLVLPRLKNWAGTSADFLFFGGISVVISPIAWEHHYGAFFFLLIFLFARADHLTQPRWLLLAACFLAMANRLPPLDHLATGLPALLGAYLFYSGIAVLALLACSAPEHDAPKRHLPQQAL